MPLYMYQAGYTAESVASLLEVPRDRITSVAKAFEDMGAEILVGGYPLGEYDVLVVYTAPDDATAAALALAIANPGALGTIDAYISAVNRLPVLTAEQETALGRRLRDTEDLDAKMDVRALLERFRQEAG